MSGVGGVGGAAGGAAPAQAASGAAPVTAPEGAQAPSTKGNGDNSSELSAGVPPASQSNMSTQDFLSLHQTAAMQPSSSACVGNDTQSEGLDLGKLMEWIIALKLLEEMNKGG